MGKIFSPPKMPDLPVVTSTPVEPVVDTSTEDAEKTADELRAANILARRRGRAGTIATSFRGVLSDAAFTPERKTLLGE